MFRQGMCQRTTAVAAMCGTTTTTAALSTCGGIFKASRPNLSCSVNMNPAGQLGRKNTPDNLKAPYGAPRYGWDWEYSPGMLHKAPRNGPFHCNRSRDELLATLTFAQRSMNCGDRNAGGMHKKDSQVFEKHFFIKNNTDICCQHCGEEIDEHTTNLLGFAYGRVKRTKPIDPHDVDIDDSTQGHHKGTTGEKAYNSMRVDWFEGCPIDQKSRMYWLNWRALIPNANSDHFTDARKVPEWQIFKPENMKYSRWVHPASGLNEHPTLGWKAPKGPAAKLRRAYREHLYGPTVQGAALARKEAAKEAKKWMAIEARTQDEVKMLEADSDISKKQLQISADVASGKETSVTLFESRTPAKGDTKEEKKKKKLASQSFYGSTLKHHSTPVPKEMQPKNMITLDSAGPVYAMNRKNINLTEHEIAGWTKIRL